MRKVGLLGGTFDPPHIGHFIIAQEVKTALNLDEVWFIPTNQPPHKESAFFSSKARFKMLKCATGVMSDFSVEALELNRSGKSYTIDTIKTLKTNYPDNHFYFIIGGDMVEYLPKWHKIDELLSLVEFVGVNRSHYTCEEDDPVTMVDTPIIDISSTEVRTRLKKGQNVKYFLPHEVYMYIKEYLRDECDSSR